MRAAGAKFKERKKKEAAPQKSRLVGAALQAVARREERERLAREAAGGGEVEAEAVKEEPVEDEEVKDEAVEESTTAAVADETGDTSAPKRDIPSCKY